MIHTRFDHLLMPSYSCFMVIPFPIPSTTTVSNLVEDLFLRGPADSTARQLGDFYNERMIVITPVQAVTLRGLEEMLRQPASFEKGARD
jgi:hypothetical protein